MLVVGVTGDATARFDRAVRWPRGSLDPRQQLWVQSSSPRYGYPNLYDVRDGREVTVAYPLAVATGFRGARLVAFGLNTSLAYDRGYHVGESVRRSSEDAFHPIGIPTAQLDVPLGQPASVSSSSTPFGGRPRSCDRC